MDGAPRVNRKSLGGGILIGLALAFAVTYLRPLASAESPASSVADMEAVRRSHLERVRRARDCKQNFPGSVVVACDFKVDGLYFTVAGVGRHDATFTVFKADWDKGPYASLAMLHGCVVVTSASARNVPSQYAFVSLADGNVYDNWHDCPRLEGR